MAQHKIAHFVSFKTRSSFMRVASFTQQRQHRRSFSQAIARHHRICTTQLIWIAMVSLHVTCAAFCAVIAFFYASLPDSRLAQSLTLYEMSLNVKHFFFVAGCYSLMGGLHLWRLGKMLFLSLFHGHLVFFAQAQRPGHESTETGHQSKRSSWLWRCVGFLTGPSESFSLFSTRSRYFGLLFILRELVETLLQSIQAYSMSRYVPRVALNRFYVVLIAINCWSTPLIRHFFKQDRQLMRLLWLFCDVLLDFTSTVGVPVSLALTYLPDFSFADHTFRQDKWDSDVWVVNWWNEFRLLLVQSWLDLFSRMLFSFSLLSCLEHIKELATAPLSSSSHPKQQGSGSTGIVAAGTNATTGSTRMVFTLRFRRIAMIVNVGLITWGIVIVGLHIEANRGELLPGCRVVVRPWLIQKEACGLLEIDFTTVMLLSASSETSATSENFSDHNSVSISPPPSLTGKALELEAIWSRVEPSTLIALSLLHLPALHVPPMIHNFKGLLRITIRNCTLVEWSSDAALSGTHHPKLRSLALVSVTLTPPESSAASPAFPVGILSTDFPPTLLDVRIEACNLTRLPVNLDAKWPRFMSLNLRNNLLESLPEDMLRRMQPMNLLLQGNRLTHVPKTIFAWPSLVVLELSRNPLISTLVLPPEAGTAEAEDASSFTPTKSLRVVSFSRTNVSRVPNWLLSSQFLSHAVLSASGTPFCRSVLAKTYSSGSVDTTRVLCLY